MPEHRAQINVAMSMDQLYPRREIGFTLNNISSDPPNSLLLKLSELIYRQHQKEEQRQKQKQAAQALTIVVSCLFFALTIAFIVSEYYKDDAIINKANIIVNNITYEESLKNKTVVPDLKPTGGIPSFLDSFPDKISKILAFTKSNSTT